MLHDTELVLTDIEQICIVWQIKKPNYSYSEIDNVFLI